MRLFIHRILPNSGRWKSYQSVCRASMNIRGILTRPYCTLQFDQWPTSFTKYFVFKTVVLPGKHEVRSEAEDDAPFGVPSSSLSKGLAGDSARSMSSSVPTKGLKGIIRGRFGVRVCASVITATPVFLLTNPELYCPLSLNLLRVQDSRCFFRVTVFSGHCFFLSPRWH